LLLAGLLPACALPPRVEDASTPERAFATFRGALAREEYDRAYALLSDRMRTKLGVHSRAEFTDWGTIGGRGVAKTMRRARPEGPPERLKDGSALLRVRVKWLFFGRDVRVRFVPIPVARVYVEGREGPAFYDHLEKLDLEDAKGVVGVRLPPGMAENLKEGVGGGKVRQFEAGIEWFLDDFEMGSEEQRK